MMPGEQFHAMAQGSWLRRAFALSGFIALVNAQAAALGCPILHHQSPAAEAAVADAPASQHHHDGATNETSDRTTQHGSAENCTMVATCMPTALFDARPRRFIDESHRDDLPRVVAQDYADPVLTLLKPPPRAA